MTKLIGDDSHATSRLMMIMAPPPARIPSLVIPARLTGDPNESLKIVGEAIGKPHSLLTEEAWIEFEASCAETHLGETTLECHLWKYYH